MSDPLDDDDEIWLDDAPDSEFSREDDWPLCSACNGSGEGMFDGSRCRTCGGLGEVRRKE